MRDAFDRNAGLFAVAIVDDDGRPIGLINRFRFLERLASRFGRELVLNKPASSMIEDDPLILDQATPIDEVGTRLMSQQNRYIFDGFIVTSNGLYSGLGTGLDLIRALTERRQAELERMALHDMLTGLPNRGLFEARLAAALGDSDHRRIAVFFIDLDRFKEINDTLGHRFGDLVLSGNSQRLRSAVRKSDVVARLSGDEFAVLVPDFADVADIGRLAEVLIHTCAAPMQLDGREVSVSCSIGAAIFPEHGDSKEALLRAADAAQYRAKESRNSWQMYHADMQASGVGTLTVSRLRGAIERGELTVHYQPIVASNTGRIYALEALVRWPDSATSAGDIVSLAESSGLIMALTELVMRQSFSQMRAWDVMLGDSTLRLAVNVSAVQISGTALLSMIERVLEDTGFSPSRLDLELTERAAMRASAAVQVALQNLRTRGITLTLDDFGTGYSALSRLERLPMDAMKIDKSFLERPGVDGTGVVARAIIAMGHALGKRVIGEGVETESQLAFLRREGCEYAQGFLLGRPADAETVGRQLSDCANRVPAQDVVTNLRASGH